MAKTLSKRLNEANKLINPEKDYNLESAIALLEKFPKPKFDETVELYANLGVDPRQSTQMIRGIVELPHGSGKQSTIVVFTEDPEPALAAGADHAGLDDLIKKVKDGWVDFDTAIATPSAMKTVRTVARILGPRGLMPNPKSGTVTDDVEAAIKSIKAGGRVEFKMDKTANVSIVVGRRSFSVEKLVENVKTAVDVLVKARPSDLKGKYIKSMNLSATMSPSLSLEPAVYSSSV